MRHVPPQRLYADDNSALLVTLWRIGRGHAYVPPPPFRLTAWHCRNLRNRTLLSFFTYVQTSKSAPLWGRFSSIKRLIRAGSRRSLYHLIHKNIFIKIFAPYIVWICYIYFVLEMPFLVRSDGVFPGLVALPYCTSFQRDKSQCNLWLSLPGNVGDRGQMQTIEKFVYSFPVLPYYSMVHWAIWAPGISITRICFYN